MIDLSSVKSRNDRHCELLAGENVTGDELRTALAIATSDVDAMRHWIDLLKVALHEKERALQMYLK